MYNTHRNLRSMGDVHIAWELSGNSHAKMTRIAPGLPIEQRKKKKEKRMICDLSTFHHVPDGKRPRHLEMKNNNHTKTIENHNGFQGKWDERPTRGKKRSSVVRLAEYSSCAVWSMGL